MEDSIWRPVDYFAESTKEEMFPKRGQLPLDIDLGSGDGTFLVEMASHYEDRNFLGCERLLGRVRKTARKIVRTGVEDVGNAKVMRLDSSYLAGWLLEDGSVDRFHLLFPDPWPKKKHHKNRFFKNEDFRRGLEKKLKLEGLFLFKTDHQEYFEMALEEMAEIDFMVKEDWPEGYYADTDFQKMWMAEGKEIYSACWKRCI